MNERMRTRYIIAGSVAGLLLVCAVWAQRKGDQQDDPNTRSVQGYVQDETGNPVSGAVVQLKNLRSLQVRSFITQEDGAYYFHGLSTNVDYELRAEQGGRTSPVRTLSMYDTRRKLVVNLRLTARKAP